MFIGSWLSCKLTLRPIHVSLAWGLIHVCKAWNSPSSPAGFADLQDGITSLGYIPGGLDCINCSDVSVTGCGFSKLVQ